MTKIAVIVPTAGRPASLQRCLSALEAQTHRPAAVIVVHPRDDEESGRVLAGRSECMQVQIDERDVVVAMAAGMERARELGLEVVAFTDDDARPEVSWLEEAARCMEADSLRVAVGGPDLRPGLVPRHPRAHPGRINTWTGRVRGQHHEAVDYSGPVDVLKGVNMIWRLEAMHLPSRSAHEYIGAGAVPHFEVFLAREAVVRGGLLHFSGAIRVLHDAAPRPDGLRFADSRVEAYNRISGVTRGLPAWRSVLVCLYSLLVGFRQEPGALRGLVGIVRREPRVLSRAARTWQGVMMFLGVQLRRGWHNSTSGRVPVVEEGAHL